MNKYVSMLRGINVCGKKKVKMDDLRSLYESMAFKNVVTYIQSGNVIFECPSIKKTELKEKIEKSIKDKYKFHVPVEIQTNRELDKILNNSPFDSNKAIEDGTRYLITFLSESPSEVKIRELQKFVSALEELFVCNQQVYIHCPDGYGKSKLSNSFLEHKLEVKATTRNWKTVNKLYELTK